jgi:hypothetical protein
MSIRQSLIFFNNFGTISQISGFQGNGFYRESADSRGIAVREQR